MQVAPKYGLKILRKSVVNYSKNYATGGCSPTPPNPAAATPHMHESATTMIDTMHSLSMHMPHGPNPCSRCTPCPRDTTRAIEWGWGGVAWWRCLHACTRWSPCASALMGYSAEAEHMPLTFGLCIGVHGGAVFAAGHLGMPQRDMPLFSSCS